MIKKFFGKGSNVPKTDAESLLPNDGSNASPTDVNPGAASGRHDVSTVIQSDTTRSAGEAAYGVGIVFQIAKDTGLYIQAMSEDGAAGQSGILEEGDCLIGIDGFSVFGWPPEAITAKMKGKLGSPVAVKFRRIVVKPDGTCEQILLAPVLTRGKVAELPQPAGIGVIFKVGHDKGMYVKAMSQDGPAQTSGQIQINDLLVAVNGREVLGRAVTEVTPMLVGRFGSKVALKFRRILPDSKWQTVKVTLARGKKATFNDTADIQGVARQRGLEKKFTVAIPDGMKPGVIMPCEDEEGNITKVLIPEFAIAGTLLRVPIKAKPTCSSDPDDLLKIQNNIKEIPGRPDVFQWGDIKILPLHHNVDGTVTVYNAETMVAVWHGYPDKSQSAAAAAVHGASVFAQDAADRQAVVKSMDMKAMGTQLQALEPQEDISVGGLQADSLDGEDDDDGSYMPAMSPAFLQQDSASLLSSESTQPISMYAIPDKARKPTPAPAPVSPQTPQSMVALRARQSVADDKTIDTSPGASVKENIEEFEKLIAM